MGFLYQTIRYLTTNFLFILAEDVIKDFRGKYGFGMIVVRLSFDLNIKLIAATANHLPQPPLLRGYGIKYQSTAKLLMLDSQMGLSADILMMSSSERQSRTIITEVQSV